MTTLIEKGMRWLQAAARHFRPYIFVRACMSRKSYVGLAKQPRVNINLQLHTCTLASPSKMAEQQQSEPSLIDEFAREITRNEPSAVTEASHQLGCSRSQLHCDKAEIVVNVGDKLYQPRRAAFPKVLDSTGMIKIDLLYLYSIIIRELRSELHASTNNIKRLQKKRQIKRTKRVHGTRFQTQYKKI